jgi:amidase
MGRSVEDVALLLGCLTGVDERDRSTQASRTRAHRDYTKFLDKDGLRGSRIGVSRNMLGSDHRVTAILESCIDLMRRMGAEIVDPADLPNYDKFGDTEVEVLLFEFKAGINKYLASLGPRSRVRSLQDVIRFNEENRDRVMPFFGQERMLAAQEKGSLSSDKYRRALSRNHRLTRRDGIDALLAKYRLDAILVASGGPAWLIDLLNGDPRSWDMESTSPAAVAGYPHITVPAGQISGLPVGLSFFTRAWGEPTLLRLAFSFEQALRARRTPRFLQSAEVGVL